ncbi:GNAT family N-acetyltransferase [Haloimpatiens sp. FM7330]|uniref:GNAT family N-acetyltransferase n=1 Tax=Haloimpatiens sp. FM7330 TaxID=3298610 RepID=UPI00364387BA
MVYEDLQEKHILKLGKLYMDAFSSPPWNEKWTLELVSKRLLQMVHCEGFYGLVCYENNEIIGMILGNHEYFYTGMQFIIKEFCIDSRLHGKGVGSALLDEFLLRLKNKGIDEVILNTLRSNETEGFYNNRGFRSLNNMVVMGKQLK